MEEVGYRDALHQKVSVKNKVFSIYCMMFCPHPDTVSDHTVDPTNDDITSSPEIDKPTLGAENTEQHVSVGQEHAVGLDEEHGMSLPSTLSPLSPSVLVERCLSFQIAWKTYFFSDFSLIFIATINPYGLVHGFYVGKKGIRMCYFPLRIA